MNGACSNSSGDYIDKSTGQAINSAELSAFLRNLTDLVKPSIAPKPGDGAAPPPTKAPAPTITADPMGWLKSGYNVVYVALAVVVVVALFSMVGGRRR